MTRRPTASNDSMVDTGTPELARRFTVVPRLSRGAMGGSMSAKVLTETEIDRLLLYDKITAMEHSILEALLKRLHRASFVGLQSPSYDAPMSSDPSIIGDRKANSIRRVTKLMLDMDRDMGPAKRKAMVNLVLTDEPWPGDDASLKGAVLALQNIFIGGKKGT